MALLDLIVKLINHWCPDPPPPYYKKLGSDSSPSNISSETSSALRVLLGRVKPVWVGAQGDCAGWVSTEWEPLSMRLCWWVFANIKKYFSFLNVFNGYIQIRIDPEDQDNMTFTCPWKIYAYKVLPFGFDNAPATFQRVVLAIFCI